MRRETRTLDVADTNGQAGEDVHTEDYLEMGIIFELGAATTELRVEYQVAPGTAWLAVSGNVTASGFKTGIPNGASKVRLHSVDAPDAPIAATLVGFNSRTF